MVPQAETAIAINAQSYIHSRSWITFAKCLADNQTIKKQEEQYENT